MSSIPIKKNNNQFLLMNNTFDDFIKKAFSIILEVRDKNFNSNNFNCTSNSDIINNKNSFSFSLDDSFNSNFSNSTTILYILEIYYVIKEEKILCEKWTIQFDSNFFLENKTSLKLNTLLRSIYCISRMNPCYNIFLNDNNTFVYKLVSHRKQKFFNESNVKINIINIQNLSVEYISNNHIKKLEEEYFQKKHNGFVLIKIPVNHKNNNRLSLNNNIIFHKRKKRLFSFEGKDNENISDITNKNNNNSFQSDLNEIKNILSLKNKSNESSIKKFSTIDSSNNLDESYKSEFEILENENDF
jgi:hypothetical protein